MLDKQRGYAYKRPFYTVDTNVNIQAGMVAFLATNASGVTVATTAASGTVPIGTFWKDRAASYVRSAVESQTFDSNNTITLLEGNILSTSDIKVTNSAGTVTYTQGADYSVTTANGVVTRLGGGSIAASATVVISYRYTVQTGQEHWEKVSTRWTTGSNYDRQANDTLGSGKIAIAEGDATIYTDQYDVTQTYTLNAAVRSNAASLWSTAATGYSVCGRVVKVPTASDPWLGVVQVRVTA